MLVSKHFVARGDAAQRRVLNLAGQALLDQQHDMPRVLVTNSGWKASPVLYAPPEQSDRAGASPQHRIVVNECLNLRRGRRQHEPIGETLEAAPTRDAAEAAELNARVDQALHELTHDQREVVVLKYFMGLTYEEIADVLGIPDKTVKSRLFTARQRLATILTEELGITG